jgi:hypothetical protein
MKRIRVSGTDVYGDFVGFDPIDSNIVVLRFSNGWGPYIGYHKDKLEFPNNLRSIKDVK